MRVCGGSDVALSDLGLRQAEQLAVALEDVHIDRIVASPLERARATARPVARQRDMEVDTLDDLREIMLGEWEGVTGKQLRDGPFAADVEMWYRHPSRVRIKGGEPLIRFKERAVSAVADVASEAAPDDTVLVVTHGGVISVYLTYLKGVDVDHIWEFAVRNCSITLVEFTGPQFEIKFTNNTSHLEPLSVH